MKKYIKWSAIALTIIIFIGGITFVAVKLFISVNSLARVEVKDSPSAEQQVIINTEFEINEVLEVIFI